MKIHNKTGPQNIATNHAADIDYKEFVKIYRKCIREPYFFAIDTTLPAKDSLRCYMKTHSLINLKFLMQD